MALVIIEASTLQALVAARGFKSLRRGLGVYNARMGYIGIIYWVCIGIMEEEMETTIMGYI